MTLQEQIRIAVARALKALDAGAEIELREAQTDLLEYFSDNLQPATIENFVVSKRTGRKRALKNSTDKLYTLYGKLQRALIPKQSGNIGQYVSEGQRRYSKIGIDLEIVPYARIHEFGGKTGRGNSATIPKRPYLFPAVELYSQQRLKDRIARIIDDMIIAWDQ